MNMNLDFRLLDVSLELGALDDHYKLIEKQLEHLTKIEHESLLEYRKRENLTPEDPEWDFSRQEFDYKVEFLLPRFFWGSFIVSLYAVYETSIIEIASFIQKIQKQEIGINDLRNEFLDRAKKYYKSILKFELCDDKITWQRLKMLAIVRNTLAHANGRLDMVNEQSKKAIKEIVKRKNGISLHYNYILIDQVFAKETLDIVTTSLNSLVVRYKEYEEISKFV